MPKKNKKSVRRIVIHSIFLTMLLSPHATAQEQDLGTAEYQAAQLRVAVDRRVARLDDEYTTRATDLRRQFNDRRRELEANAESEIELSNGIAAISRVYQDSLAGLQREINGRRNNVYIAQSSANEELDTQGTISAETWARISSTPREELIIDWSPPVSAPEAVTADAIAVTAMPVEAPVADTPSVASRNDDVVSSDMPAPRPSGCESAWYPDRDRDLFGDAGSTATFACYPNRPSGFVDNNYDCDDSNSTINPITGRCAPQ